MKIGELFIALGFDIKGQQDFDDADRGIQKSTVHAIKLTVAVNAVNWALLAMLETAGRAGMGLRNFARETGLSTDSLQMWQHSAVRQGIAADVLTQKIKLLQDTRAQFALGEPENVGAWSMLGVDPRQDPFKVIEQLRARVRNVGDIGVARNLLGRIGMEELLPLLRSSNEEFAKWHKNFVLTGQQTARLARLNSAWESLKLSLVAVKNQFAAALAPGMERLARLFEFLAARVAAFTGWLDRGGTAATIVRTILQLLAVGMLALGTALVFVTTTLGALRIALFLLSPAIWSVLGAFAPFALVLGLTAGALAALVLLIDDFMTAAAGGKSFGNWNTGILLTVDNVNKLAAAIEWVLTLNERMFKAMPEWYQKMAINHQTVMGNINSDQYWKDRIAEKAGRANLPAVAGTTQNHTEIKVQVDGSSNPRETAREVGRELREQFRAATAQAPAPSQ